MFSKVLFGLEVMALIAAPFGYLMLREYRAEQFFKAGETALWEGDWDKAYVYYQEAARRDNDAVKASVACRLTLCKDFGLGVAPWVATTYLNGSSSQSRYNAVYTNNYLTVPQDYDEAAAWYRMAAVRGRLDAQRQLIAMAYRQQWEPSSSWANASPPAMKAWRKTRRPPTSSSPPPTMAMPRPKPASASNSRKGKASSSRKRPRQAISLLLPNKATNKPSKR